MKFNDFLQKIDYISVANTLLDNSQVVKLVNSRSTLKINDKKLSRITLMSATRHSKKSRKECAYGRIPYKRRMVLNDKYST